MLIFVAMRGDQIGAIDGTIDGDFALFAAANGADFFAFGGTESLSFSLFAERAGHAKQNTLCRWKIKNVAVELSATYGPTSALDGDAKGCVRTCSGRNPIPMIRAGPSMSSVISLPAVGTI